MFMLQTLIVSKKCNSLSRQNVSVLSVEQCRKKLAVHGSIQWGACCCCASDSKTAKKLPVSCMVVQPSLTALLPKGHFAYAAILQFTIHYNDYLLSLFISFITNSIFRTNSFKPVSLSGHGSKESWYCHLWRDHRRSFFPWLKMLWRLVHSR